jgi:hypothetical protein
MVVRGEEELHLGDLIFGDYYPAGYNNAGYGLSPSELRELADKLDELAQAPTKEAP